MRSPPGAANPTREATGVSALFPTWVLRKIALVVACAAACGCVRDAHLAQDPTEADAVARGEANAPEPESRPDRGAGSAGWPANAAYDAIGPTPGPRDAARGARPALDATPPHLRRDAQPADAAPDIKSLDAVADATHDGRPTDDAPRGGMADAVPQRDGPVDEGDMGAVDCRNTRENCERAACFEAEACWSAWLARGGYRRGYQSCGRTLVIDEETARRLCEERVEIAQPQRRSCDQFAVSGRVSFLCGRQVPPLVRYWMQIRPASFGDYDRVGPPMVRTESPGGIGYRPAPAPFAVAPLNRPHRFAQASRRGYATVLAVAQWQPTRRG